MLCLKPSIEALSSQLLGFYKVNNTNQVLRLYDHLGNLGLKTHVTLINDIIPLLVDTTSWCPTQQKYGQFTCLDECAWISVIVGHFKYGFSQNSVSSQQAGDGRFDHSSNICLSLLLKACAALNNNLERAIALHIEIARTFLGESAAHIGSTLIHMYARCNSVEKAQDVFQKLEQRDIQSWNALICAFVAHGHCKESLGFFHQMQSEGIPPDAVTFVCCLKACGTIRDKFSGLYLHSESEIKGNLKQSNWIGSALVDMYAKCGDLAEAKYVFESLPCKDTFTWMSLLAGYSNHGHGHNALECLKTMQHEGIHINAITYVCGLKACISLGVLNTAQELHGEIARTGLFEGSLHVCSALVHMYSKCGYFRLAKEVFDSVQAPNEVLWNALIASYVEWGLCIEAIHYYEQMLLKGFCPDFVTYTCSLKACSGIRDVQKVLPVHCEIAKRGLETDTVVGTALVDSYVKSSSPTDGRKVLNGMHFRNSVTWNALIAAYADQGLTMELLACYGQMQLDGVNPDAVTFVFCIKTCGLIDALEMGQIFHREATKKGMELELLVGGSLIDMYCRFQWFAEAQIGFDRLSIRDGVSWNALIAGYIDSGHVNEALKLLERMESEHVFRDGFSLVCGLKACGSTCMKAKGQEIHIESVKKGMLERDSYLCSALISMYAQCESLEDALAVVVHAENVTSWNALIAGLAEHMYCKEALNYYECMLLKGIVPDAVTFLSILRVCGVIKAPKEGQMIHIHIVKRGLETELQLGSTLVDMYGKFGSLAEAEDIFKKLQVRNVVSWNVLITNFLEHGKANQVLSCLQKMELEGISWDVGTAISCLKAVANMGSADGVRKIYDQILRKGLESSTLVANTLMVAYAGACLLTEAHHMFWKIPLKDNVSWNAVIAGNVEQGQAEEALYFFEQMETFAMSPDAVTFTFLLKACGCLDIVERGRQVHSDCVKRGLLEVDVFAGTTLVDMYANCGLLVDAHKVFDKLLLRNLVSWNALLAGYVQNGLGEEALNLFKQMQDAGIVPDSATACCILKAYSNCENIVMSAEMQAFIIKAGFDRELVVGNTLVDVYGKWGSMLEAKKVLDRLPSRDIVSWTTLMSGYTGHGAGKAALDCFEQMQQEGISGSEVSFACGLKACGNSDSLTKGQRLHSQIVKIGLEGELHIANTLVDMYSKSGFYSSMQQVFDGHLKRDIVAWNALIAGYAQLGESDMVVSMFNDLLAVGISPDIVTFTSVLNAFTHAGLVIKGGWFFQAIDSELKSIPSLDHYTCMVDLLGRAGILDGAISCIEWMPFQPGILPWQILLGACRKWGDADLGQHAFDHTVWLDANAAASYVCLFNLFADGDH